MGLLNLLPKRYKEQVTFFRYVSGQREDIGTATARFSYESSPDSLSDLSGEQFDAKLLMEDAPDGIRVKHYVEREKRGIACHQTDSSYPNGNNRGFGIL